MYLGKNIRILRKKAGLTQKELADKLGMTYSNIGRYENDGTMPPVNTLLELCELFSVNIDDIIHKDLTEGETSKEPWVVEEKGNKTLLKIIDRLEKQLSKLEKRIKQEDPDLAEKLGIE